jgi:hypothetical protein
MPTQAAAARELAAELDLLGRAVFFGDWVPYDDWPNVLLECDLALTLHRAETLESHLAFRSRVLDYIWAGLPIIATRGDVISDLVQQKRIGLQVACGDVHGVARAILSLLETPRSSFQKAFDSLRVDMTWERVSQPLIEFCRAPRRAPDKIALGKQVGSPFYRDQLTVVQRESDTARAQVEHLSGQVHEFENRRAVRVANWVQRQWKRLDRSST